MASAPIPHRIARSLTHSYTGTPDDEGFVNTFVGAADGSALIVFTTESIENIPPGWRARETYRITADGELHEVFELAEPGKDFTVYSETRLRRQP